jgi:hypothetical protein
MNSPQSAANRNHCYQDSHLMVDSQLQTVELDGQLIELTQKEFDLLALLVRRAGELAIRLLPIFHARFNCRSTFASSKLVAVLAYTEGKVAAQPPGAVPNSHKPSIDSPLRAIQ